MKVVMKKNLLYILSIAYLMVACVDEMPNNTPHTSEVGDAVQFIAGLSGSDTKTIYGDEVITNGIATAIKINWVNGDLVSVYGDNTLESREQGTYKVTAATNSPYAGELQMVGDHGVQWGGEKSSFYAVYPSTNGNFEPLTDGSGVKVPASISGVQSNFFTFKDGTWTGVQGDSESNLTMIDAIMYACNTGEDGGGLPNGATVNLQFKPFSTVLKFTLNGVGTPSGKTKVYINEIDVIAPTNISGTFPLTIKSNNTASAGAITNGSETVIIKPYSIDETTNETVNNIYVEADDVIEFSVFTVPQENINLSGWKVRLVTSHGTKTFTINDATANVNAKLLAGQIHKVRVPALATLEDDFKFNPAEWIAQLPTTVYLSELSLPGSWYSTNTEDGYQVVTNGTTDLEGQYASGIRAFNIDCRLSIAEGRNLKDYFGNNDYRIVEDINDYYNGDLVLACAGTEKDETSTLGAATGTMATIGKTVETAIQELGAIISRTENQDEFIVIVLSVAEKCKDRSAKLGSLVLSQHVFGTINPKMMLEAIADVLNKDNIKQYLYLDHITKDTTIENVLGKIIIKVNLNTSNEKIISYGLTNNVLNENFDAPMMLSSGSMVSNSDYKTGDIEYGVFNAVNSPAMICGHDYKTSDLIYYNHQAQLTYSSGSTSPTISERQTAITSIMNTASVNYNSEPSVKAWYQLGIGGSLYNGTITSLATTMNQYVYKEVMKKMGYTFDQNLSANSLIIPDTEDGLATGTPKITEANKDITPVGIVLMNQCLNTSCYGQKLIDAILTLNAKLKMQAAE